MFSKFFAALEENLVFMHSQELNTMYEGHFSMGNMSDAWAETRC